MRGPAILASTPPLTRYTTTDGLPTNDVLAIFSDHLGFPWVDTDDGFPSLHIDQILETPIRQNRHFFGIAVALL